MTIFWQWGTIQVSNYQAEFQQGFIEVSPDSGKPFRRQTFTDIQKLFAGKVTLTRTEKLDFESWYRWDTKQGTIPFQYWDCEIEAYRTTRILGKPTITSNSNYFDVSLQLAFDPAIVYQQRELIANPDSYLLVNPDLRLVVGKKLRL